MLRFSKVLGTIAATKEVDAVLGTFSHIHISTMRTLLIEMVVNGSRLSLDGAFALVMGSTQGDTADKHQIGEIAVEILEEMGALGMITIHGDEAFFIKTPIEIGAEWDTTLLCNNYPSTSRTELIGALGEAPGHQQLQAKTIRNKRVSHSEMMELNVPFIRVLNATKLVLTPAIHSVDETLDSADYASRTTLKRRKAWFELVDGKIVYQTWYYDPRGRTYAANGIISSQGSDMAKACFAFAPYTVEAAQAVRYAYWLKVHIANCCGYDKITYAQRVAKVDNLSADDLQGDTHQLMEGLRNLAEFENIDTTKAFTSTAVAQFDGTTSGCQMMAAMLSCPKSLRATNLMPSEVREVTYAAMYAKYCEEVPGSDIPYKELKGAIIPALYNSIAEPMKLVGKDNLPKFFEAMGAVVPAFTLFKSAINSFGESLKTTVIRYKMPDGFHVHFELKAECELYEEIVVDDVRYPIEHVYTEHSLEEYGKLIGNLTHSVDAWVLREMIGLSKWGSDKSLRAPVEAELAARKQPGYNPGNVAKEFEIPSIWTLKRGLYDLGHGGVAAPATSTLEAIVRMMDIVKVSFPVLPIHDSFGVPPHFAPEIQALYREVLSNIVEGDMIKLILDQIDPVNKWSNPMEGSMRAEVAKKVRKSTYALT